MKKKYPHYLPKGWTLKDVQKVIAYYDRQSDEEGAAEIEAAEADEAVMIVPLRLVPSVRRLIAQKSPAGRSHRRAAVR
jgi:hypothetical protein